MAKFYKIIKTILIVLGIIVGCAWVALYVINKEEAINILTMVKELLAQPVPIVGMSVLSLAVLLLKILDRTSVGKKAIAEAKKEYEENKAKDDAKVEAFIGKQSAILMLFSEKVDTYTDAVIRAFEKFPNKNMQEEANNLKVNLLEYKNRLKEELDSIANADTQVLIQTKDNIINEVMEYVRKEVLDKYGEEGQKVIDSIPEAEKI